MDWKIELIFVPVTDVDRAKEFYADKVGFHVDFDHRVNEGLRFVQLTPPGSACSIAFGEGLIDMPPGSQKGIQVVVPDADEAYAHLTSYGVDATPVEDLAWGTVRDVRRPGRQRLGAAAATGPLLTHGVRGSVGAAAAAPSRPRLVGVQRSARVVSCWRGRVSR